MMASLTPWNTAYVSTPQCWLYQQLKDTVAFDTTLLYQGIYFTVWGRGCKFISTYWMTSSPCLQGTIILLSPLLPVLRIFLIFICINRDPFLPITNLYVSLLKKKNSSKTRGNKNPPTKSKLKQKTRKFSFLL